MTTEPPDVDALDALDAAEDAHVEACTGVEVRSSLILHIAHLRAVDPAAVDRLLGGRTMSGDEWIESFLAPTRLGWAGKRYPDGVGQQIVALLADLDTLQTKTAEAYRATIKANTPETTP